MTAGRTTQAGSQHWGTPPKYVEPIKRFFGGKIGLDPCSNEYSIVHADIEYRLPEVDGLRVAWDASTIFVNPPYGSDRDRGTRITHWMECCALAARSNSEVIALVPVATNTSHWKKYVWGQASAIAFLYDTRLKFLENGKDIGKGAPMSCALIYWGPRVAEFRDIFQRHAAVVDIRDLDDCNLPCESVSQSPELFVSR